MSSERRVTEEEIRQLFESTLRPRIAKLESEKKLLLRKLAVLLALSLTAYFPLEVFSPGHPVLHGLLCALAAGTSAFVLISPFVNKFKAVVMKEIFSALIADCTYAPEGSVSQKDFDASGIVTLPYTNFHGEDLVTGRIGKLSVEFSEILASTSDENAAGDRQTQKIFQGLFFCFSFPENLTEKTIEQRIGPLTDFWIASEERVGVRTIGSRLYIGITTSKDYFEPDFFGEVFKLQDVTEIFHLLMLVRNVAEVD